MTHRNTPRKTSKQSQKGVTLTEVLVAIVVFAIGMLGQAAFMLTTMQNGMQSRYRVIASYYAEELIGMALADVGNRAKYVIQGSTCVDANWTPCSQWLTRLKTDIPQVTGQSVTVTIDSTAGVISIDIPWKGLEGAETQHYLTTSNLNFIK